MANGIYERGEMYDILSSEAMFGELASHRPGIIISSEIGNQTSSLVTMVYCTTTTTTRELSVNHRFTMRGIEQLALCSQIVTVNKKRLSKFYGKLNDSDMKAVDRCVRQALGFEDVELTALKVSERVIAEKNAEIELLKSKVAEAEAKIENVELSCKVENAMWQKLYEKALGQVVDMKYANDLGNKAPTPPAPPEEVPIVNVPAPVEFQRKKVNVNTASGKEIIESLGVSKVIAYSITGYRNKNGRFVEVEELLEVAKITKPMFERIKDYIEIAPVEESANDASVEESANDAPVEESAPKVNINTASARKLMAVGFSKEVASRIVHSRKMRGPFNAVDDLERVDGISAGDIRKLRDMLEI